MSKGFNTATYTGSVAGPINLASFSGENEGAADVYFMMFDSATTPVNGATPNVFFPVHVPAGQPFSDDIVPIRPIVNTLYWVASSTQPTLTIAAGATLNVDLGY